MKLLAEIIDLLSNENGSLSEALLKTKILLHKIGQQELTGWVNHELNGYPEGFEIPHYRVLSAEVFGNVMNARFMQPNYPLPLGHLSSEQRASLQTTHMREGLGVLEMMTKGKGGHIEATIPPEAYALLGKAFQGGYTVQRAWCQMPKTAVAQILIEVRSRLLDFVLGLQDKIGDNVTDGDVKKAADSAGAAGMFAHAVFGDNVTVLVGDYNQQHVSNASLKGNFGALADELKKHGVVDEDIDDLKSAIDADKDAPELGERKFGPAVRNWLQKMWGKAVETSWQIELAIAGNLLTTALQNYYG